MQETFCHWGWARRKNWKLTNRRNANSTIIVEAYYKGFLDPAVSKYIDRYYKLPVQQISKNGNKFKARYCFKWAGLEAFKKDMEGVFNTEKNAFKCTVSMVYYHL